MIKMLMMVGLGSFAGGILRFLLSRFVQVNSASSFPWGTAAVNLLGCFILGALYGLFDRTCRIRKRGSFLPQACAAVSPPFHADE